MMRRLPVPRLQLRWYRNDSPLADCPTECTCELILPVANDARDVGGHSFIAVPLGDRRFRGASENHGFSNDSQLVPDYQISIDGTTTPLNAI